MSKQIAVIRHPGSGLVMDVTDDGEVQIQHFTGFPAQLWKLEKAGSGKYFIINQSKGYVMDIAHGNSKVIITQKNGGTQQQWCINSDKTIVNAKRNLALDLCGAYTTPGTNVIAYRKHGYSNQQFDVQYEK